ncbi:MAG TPA: helix-turn-helix transcriptional regulator [Bdellovibrio sp.]|nr:helix-turn-helix transcriptional regulator [Bdellovibrio sp.]
MGLARLSEFLKEKRVSAHMTQGQVAEILGYTSPQFVSNWERGMSYPPVETLKQLAKIYDVKQEEVFQVFLKSSIEDMEKDLTEKFFHERRRRRAQ